MKINTLFALFFVLLVTIGCQKKEVEPLTESKPNQSFAKTTIDTLYREFESAFNAGDAEAVANCYATDAKLMPPNDKSAQGRQAIKAVFTDWFKGDTVILKLELVQAWSSEGQLMAENQWKMTTPDGILVDSGKSLEIYTQEDGKWKLLRDCFNSDLPLLPPPPPAPIQ